MTILIIIINHFISIIIIFILVKQYNNKTWNPLNFLESSYTTLYA